MCSWKQVFFLGTWHSLRLFSLTWFPASAHKTLPWGIASRIAKFFGYRQCFPSSIDEQNKACTNCQCWQPSLAANCTDRKLATARTPEADKGPGWNNAACKSGCAHCKRFLAQALRQRPPDACQRVWSNMRLQPMTCTRWSNCKLVFRLVLALAGNIQSAIARVTIPSSWESALASSMSLQAITHTTRHNGKHMHQPSCQASLWAQSCEPWTAQTVRNFMLTPRKLGRPCMQCTNHALN